MSRLRCLITGGGGFIGKNLCKALIKSNYEVIILDYKVHTIGIDTQFNLVVGDFGDNNILDKALKDVDYVFHLACTTIPQTSAEDPIYDIQSNIIGTINLLKNCVKYKVKKIIYLSSGGTVYGYPINIPIDEGHPTNPINFHGTMKLTNEKYIQAISHIYNLEYLIFRLSNVYGVGYDFIKPQGAVNIFLHNIMYDKPISIWGDGSVIRDYIWIDDVINAIISGIERGVKNRIYNIGSGVGVSLNELIALIEDVTQKKAKVSLGQNRIIDIPVNILDIKSAQKELGWNYKLKLRDGIRFLFDYYSSQKLP